MSDERNNGKEEEAPPDIPGLDGERLKDIQDQIESTPPPEGKRGGRKSRGQRKAEAEAEAERAELRQELEESVEKGIKFLNDAFTKRGLQPMNFVQEELIRAGFIGTGMKYGISFDKLKMKRPEAAALVGLGWVAKDKYEEIQVLRAQAEAQDNPGDKPGRREDIVESD